MYRYLSAIGISEYISKKRLDSFVQACLLSTDMDTDIHTDATTGETTVELTRTMDTFGFVLRGAHEGASVALNLVMPIVRTFRNYMRLTNWDVEELEDVRPVLCGDDVQFGTPVEVVLTQRHPLVKRYLDAPPVLNVGLCALSTSGQILLNVVRNAEDEQAYREEEDWRREMANRVRQGDRDAERSLTEDALMIEEDMRERLKTEDVYTILESLIIPADDSTFGLYNILGTITAIHKIMNPLTEEWVYEFELNVMGTPYNVYINPRDLEGQPSVGMRFQGSIMLIGDVMWDME